MERKGLALLVAHARGQKGNPIQGLILPGCRKQKGLERGKLQRLVSFWKNSQAAHCSIFGGCFATLAGTTGANLSARRPICILPEIRKFMSRPNTSPTEP